MDANPVGECSSSTKTAQEAECSKKMVREADCSKRTVREAKNEPAQEAEKREDGRAAEHAPPSPPKAGRPKVSFAEQTLEKVLVELPEKTLMKKAGKEKPSSGSFDLWEQLKQMLIAMTAAQLLELVPRF